MGQNSGCLSTPTHAYEALSLHNMNMAETVGVGSSQSDAGPVSFADLGIPQPPKLQNTLFGKARRIQDVEIKERVFIIVTILTLLATLGFTIYKLCTVDSKNPDFTFALVLLVSILFAGYYTLHGVLQERATEILVLSIAIGIVVIYLIVNYTAGSKGTVKLVRLIVAVAISPFLVGIGLYLSLTYHRSGNLIFRTVGANAELQNMCRLLFCFFDLLKFDMQLSISMVIFILTSRLKVDTEDIVVLSAGGVASIIWFVIAYDSMKRENRVGAWIFFLLSPMEFAYVIYKLYQTSEYINKFSGLAGSTIACGVVALVVRTVVFLVGVFVYRNFNKGLREKAFGGPSDVAQQVQGGQGEFVP